MPSVAEYLDLIDTAIPLSKAAGWDPVGLQVGDRAAEAGAAAVCHEVTEEVTAALEHDPVDVLVTYHPLLFRPAPSFVAGASASGRAFRLARAGVAVTVVHTAFDVAAGGAADALATAIGIGETAGFGPNWGPDSIKVVTFVPAASVVAVTAAMAAAGAGRIGNYRGCSYRSEGHGAFTPLEGANPAVGTVGSAELEPETRLEMVAPASAAERVTAALVAAHPYEEPAYDVYDVRSNAGFIGRWGGVEPMTLGDLGVLVGEATQSHARIAGALDRRIERVAVVPGSGASFIPEAARVADVLVTGDVSHHRAREALARRLAVVDVGHVPSERPGLAKLYAAVTQLGVPVRSLLDLDPDPWS